MRTIMFAGGILLTACNAAPAGMFIMEPPPQFNHPYRGQLVEHRHSWQQARATCASLIPKIVSLAGYNKRPDACAWRAGAVCHIVIPAGSGIPQHETAAYRRHEIAHCNGWDAAHTGRR